MCGEGSHDPTLGFGVYYNLLVVRPNSCLNGYFILSTRKSNYSVHANVCRPGGAAVTHEEAARPD